MSKLHEKLFKYRAYLDKYESCPPVDYAELEMEAWRWVFENLMVERNFQPVLIIKPSRLTEKMFQSDEAKCDGYGLSFFDTLENAKGRYLNMYATFREHKKNFEQVVGSLAACLKINPGDGVGSKPSDNLKNKGHFTFHEYEGCDFFSRIVQTQNLLP